ncbi:sigma-54-dependent Fis family transcriptional regulator [Pseudomonas citronellolis]|uniref:sigma-54-dependent Fis family transcriptional regulator n=1 Tax=Pseudomonas citronellolis TaxID=53408 RepID=UPI000778C92F|nr:sigma-54-dependent Fis family transcriptional regulator [Pseudomonas citronellolis]AMO75997.1 Nitrogen fixation protein VnfA [Pseudomonas citronellolis]
MTHPVSDAPNSPPRINIITDLRFPDMQDLTDQLYFNPKEGLIWLGGKRMMLLHVEAFGALRQELLESNGVEFTRGLFTRIGYLTGLRDADLAIQARGTGNELEILAAGGQLHALSGIVEVAPKFIEVDPAKGYLHGEFTWKRSVESDVHIAANGTSTDPICWMEVGYSSGFLTRLMGRRFLVREIECQACGHEHCRVVARPVEDWDDAEEDLKYFQPRATDHRRTPPTLRTRLVVSPQQAPFGLGIETPLPTDLDRPVGSSAAYHNALHKILRVAGTNATVLLLGESGVGKTMFAHEVHANSQRADAAFVEINCAAIPEQLIESELFGVQRGAYSGATEARPGRFEIAHGGTIFLDEVATLSMTAQGKLLRVLQSGELERLGSNKTIKVDVRVIAATNEDLAKAVKAGTFRSDLFYRLNVFPVTIAPLRERKDDLPLLLDTFVRKLSALHGRRLNGITPRALQVILDYHWPGNIREFENVVERAVILADDGDALDIRHLSGLDALSGQLERIGTLGWDASPSIGIRMPDATPTPGLGSAQQENASRDQLMAVAQRTLQRGPIRLSEIEEVYIEVAMQLSEGNISKAAPLLGLSRAQLDYRLKKMQNEGA